MPVSTTPIRRFSHREHKAIKARSVIAHAILCYLLAAAHETSAFDHVHTLSPAYHASVIESESESSYNFHSPSISYGAFLGRKVGFRCRLTAFFPSHLFQDGQYFHARDYYSPAFGGEVLLGAAYTFHLPDDQLVIADIGAALNAIKLGSDTYESFYSLTFGIGAGVEYLYPLNRVLTLGSFISAAGHFLDLIHDADGLKYGVFICAGITLGLRFHRPRAVL